MKKAATLKAFSLCLLLSTFVCGAEFKFYSEEQLNTMRLETFRDVCTRLEISDFFANKLRMLEGFKIVIICDDSGSMNSLSDALINQGDPFGPKPTRWDELKHTVGTIIDIASVLSINGVDILFLNRTGFKNITNRYQINPLFAQKPAGGTPIVPVLHSIFKEKTENNRLVILATDGVPNDHQGNNDTRAFKKLLQTQRSPQDYVTIVACTDDANTVSYLNNWDKELINLDVVDDYVSERGEILRAQGLDFSFSYGDYVVKCMLGSIDPALDALDECGPRKQCECALF